MREVAEAYLNCRALSPGTVTQVRVALGHWQRFFQGRRLCDLKLADLDAFSVYLLKSASPASVNKTRAHIRAILTWAADSEVLTCPRVWARWKKLKEPKAAPVAFLAEEFQTVLRVAREWPGWICGVPAGAWWESLLLSLWYSGGRIGAVMEVTWADVLVEQRGFYLRAAHQKQAADQFFLIGEDCVESLRRAESPKRELVWPWSLRREALYRAFRRVLTVSGIEAGHSAGCLFHRIRKSTASYLKAAGADATGQLGHSCVSVTQRYYDPRIVGSHDSTAFMPNLSR